jgi:hypothetical protein
MRATTCRRESDGAGRAVEDASDEDIGDFESSGAEVHDIYSATDDHFAYESR